jgi:hypothetical protein
LQRWSWVLALSQSSTAGMSRQYREYSVWVARLLHREPHESARSYARASQALSLAGPRATEPTRQRRKRKPTSLVEPLPPSRRFMWGQPPRPPLLIEAEGSVERSSTASSSLMGNCDITHSSSLLIDHAALHYERNIFQFTDVLQRIARNRNDVGQIARLQQANLPVPPEQLRSVEQISLQHRQR